MRGGGATQVAEFESLACQGLSERTGVVGNLKLDVGRATQESMCAAITFFAEVKVRTGFAGCGKGWVSEESLRRMVVVTNE